MRCSRLILPVILLLAQGCAMVQATREAGVRSNHAIVSGDVVSSRGFVGVQVVLYGETGEGFELAGIAGLSALQDTWAFAIETDTSYVIGAFQDLNGDLVWNQDEALGFLGLDSPIRLTGQTSLLQLQLPIEDGRDLPSGFDLDLRGAEDLHLASLVFKIGEIVTLDDERFSLETASAGMWRPLTAMKATGAGLYFLEAYDPERTPVLFVHGIGGTPRDLEVLIDKLDRSRFQPWIFQYPSGFRLGNVARSLARQTAKLCDRLGVDTIHIVAHSMGGLVSRAAILELADSGHRRGMIGLFLTLASPIEGHAASAWGVRYFPDPVPAWIDMEPSSAFLQGLKRPLPSSIDYYLLYGYRRGGNPIMLTSHDSVVEVSSQIPLWAQREAREVWGFNLDHMDILSDEDSVATYLEILAGY